VYSHIDLEESSQYLFTKSKSECHPTTLIEDEDEDDDDDDDEDD
jgi:hypothetical protein